MSQFSKSVKVMQLLDQQMNTKKKKMTEETEGKNTRAIKEAEAAAKTAESIPHHRSKSIILIEKYLFKHGSLAFAGFKIIKREAQITCRSIYTTFNLRLTHHVVPSKVCGRCRLPQTE